MFSARFPRKLTTRVRRALPAGGKALATGLLPLGAGLLAVFGLDQTMGMQVPLLTLLVAVCYSALTQVPGAGPVSVLGMAAITAWALYLPGSLPLSFGDPTLTVYLISAAGVLLLALGSYHGLRRNARERETLERERERALEDANRQWRQRNEALLKLNEATNLLSSSHSPEEVAEIVSRYIPRIFPGTRGAVYFCSRIKSDRLHWTSQWGRFDAAPPAKFDFDSCWALRRGQLHSYTPGNGAAPPCPHIGNRDNPSHCIPIIVNGQTTGLLTLEYKAEADEAVNPAADLTLLRSLNEQMGLALANLRLNEDLREQAVRDPLTGLFNRRWFEEEVDWLLTGAERHKTPVALLMVDIDNFKRINDNHGHAVGDEVLHHVAALVNEEKRASDLAARYGGDEFMIALPGHDSVAAIRLAERLRNVFDDERKDVETRLPPVSVSIGIASYPADGLSLKSILKFADEALYEAKRRGRNQVYVYGMTVAQIAPPKTAAGEG